MEVVRVEIWVGACTLFFYFLKYFFRKYFFFIISLHLPIREVSNFPKRSYLRLARAKELNLRKYLDNLDRFAQCSAFAVV